MINWWQALLIGGGIGLFIGMPLIVWIRNSFRKVNERRRAKRLINEGKFLIPIDPNDYDTKAWEKYITIDKEAINGLNKKIFTKKNEKTFEEIQNEIKQEVNATI